MGERTREHRPRSARPSRFFEEWKALVAKRPSTKGLGHSFLAPAVAHVFESLRVSASLWNRAAGSWFPLHHEPSVLDFEVEHGKDFERGPYNERLFAQAAEKRTSIRGEHAGYSDLFVPILLGERRAAVLISGPFSVARPTSSGILASWHWLTGRQGHPADPEFSSYLARALSTLVLDGRKLESFERLLDCLAQLLAGEGLAEKLAAEAHALGTELEQSRSTDRMWEAVQSMVDGRFPGTWNSMGKLHELFALGLSGAPDQVLVGLTLRRTPGPDPVADALRLDALQRRSVEVARAAGGVIAGRVGDYGVLFLLSGSAAQRKKQTLSELSDKMSALARREFGLSLHFGASASSRSEPLSRSYQAALAAAESALVKGSRIVFVDPDNTLAPRTLHGLRRELGRVFEHHPDSLAPRFDGYLEAVALRCGYRVESARGHLEAGFERLAEPLLESGALDEKSFRTLSDELDRGEREAKTINDLFEAYRRAVADLSQAVSKPASARKDRGLRHALDFMRQHYSEPLRLDQVARVAGITPDYFSKLFKERERTTFEKYVRDLRLERARQLLADTGLSVARVAEMSGFNSQQYFSRVFRRVTGRTPLDYRNSLPPQGSRKAAKRYKTNSEKYKKIRRPER
ncbi:MAG TPA: AraC family transcriptional regulator [Polyangiaceae bacterium]|jgi:AraC-like DNA-binding protein|nr:AraC family transcriptional regulator [Polyangiaceae bacterium]